MVVTRRSFWLRCAAATAAALLFTHSFRSNRTFAGDDTTTTTANAATKNKKKSTTSKTQKTRKTATSTKAAASLKTTPRKTTTIKRSSNSNSLRVRVRPKPVKPIPLTPLHPVPIEMGDAAPLVTFFQALASLASSRGDTQLPQVVHIIHFGDSHVASDYWAGVLREALQGHFGNAGPGFVLPGRPWLGIRYADAKSLDGVGWRTDGLRLSENDGVVGLGGMSLESYRAANPASVLAEFTQFELFVATSPGAECFQVQADGADIPDLALHSEAVIPVPSSAPETLVPEPSPQSLGGGAAAAPDPPAPVTPVRSRTRRKTVAPVVPWHPWPADSPLDLLEISNASPLAAGPHRISIRSSCGSKARVLGMELYNGSQGVVYDTDGVNGARLVDLDKPLPALRKALLEQAHPALIIVSYGTNDIGLKGFTSSGYEETAFQILTRLKQDAGDASILVTGPTDRGSPRRKMRLFIQAAQAELQPALRRAALRAGCAYWDQQAAMGGPGAMARWVRAGLGQYDHVHLTALGYKKMADLLYAQLLAEYAKFQAAQTAQ